MHSHVQSLNTGDTPPHDPHARIRSFPFVSNAISTILFAPSLLMGSATRCGDCGWVDGTLSFVVSCLCVVPACLPVCPVTALK
ncbi:hypothetical protein B0H10DRAFT_750344 [Mycena sp. CBHHK59/15]|nr:hypothetical protein B0H10DRAFT_750344 [Mycena sp. CBHHK59/15]